MTDPGGNRSPLLDSIDRLTAAGYGADVPPVLLSFAEKAMHTLAGRYPWPDTDEEMWETINEAIEQAVPHGALLWQVCGSDLDIGRLPGPGAVASTLEEVVRDVLIEAVETVVTRWVDAVDQSTGQAQLDHGFAWIGQSWEGCETCGRPAREHPGMQLPKPGAGPFDKDASEIVPWEEAVRRTPLAGAYGLLEAVGKGEHSGRYGMEADT